MNLLESLQIPTSTLDLFIRSVNISSYLPGRVRLHCRRLVGNPQLEKHVQDRLQVFREIGKVETSTVTGSILIHYVPEVLRANVELRKVEEYIRLHARRK